MKPPVMIALICTSVRNVSSGARSTTTVEGLYWKSSTFAATAVAGRARTATRASAAAAAALSSSRSFAVRELRGGGSGGVGGGEADQLGTSRSRDGNPASQQRGGDVGGRMGSTGEKAAEHSSKGGLGVDGEASKPAASVVAPKQEQKGDAKENALREALILADGPNK